MKPRSRIATRRWTVWYAWQDPVAPWVKLPGTVWLTRGISYYGTTLFEDHR